MGDSPHQALLREKMIRKGRARADDPYFRRIRAVVREQDKVLDIGCGTAHVIRRLAVEGRADLLMGLDLSPAMLRIAKDNVGGMTNVELMLGDGFRLPIRNGALQVVLSRLAEHSQSEAFRSLETGGHYAEVGLGPQTRKEVAEFFPKRLERDSFFFPRDPMKWKLEPVRRARRIGFKGIALEEHLETYYQTKDELCDLIEMVPLVKGFDRLRDARIIGQIRRKYGLREKIRTTWHYYVLSGTRP